MNRWAGKINIEILSLVGWSILSNLMDDRYLRSIFYNLTLQIRFLVLLTIGGVAIDSSDLIDFFHLDDWGCSVLKYLHLVFSMIWLKSNSSGIETKNGRWWNGRSTSSLMTIAFPQIFQVLLMFIEPFCVTFICRRRGKTLMHMHLGRSSTLLFWIQTYYLRARPTRCLLVAKSRSHWKSRPWILTPCAQPNQQSWTGCVDTESIKLAPKIRRTTPTWTHNTTRRSNGSSLIRSKLGLWCGKEAEWRINSSCCHFRLFWKMSAPERRESPN